MGAPVPPSVQEYPERVHGINHWVEYTPDGPPSQYHAYWKYMNGAVPALATVKMVINPGYLGSLASSPARVAFLEAYLEAHPDYEPGTPTEQFAALVEKYEEGKTPDEIVVLIDSQGFSQMFVDGWDRK